MTYYRVRACISRVSSGAEVITRDEFPKKESVLEVIDSLLNFVAEKDTDLKVVQMTVREIG